MINGKCFPAEVSLSLDGTMALGGIGTTKKAYSVRLNQPDDFSAVSPFVTSFDEHTSKDTSLNEKYGKENRGFFLTTNYIQGFGLRFIHFSSLYHKQIPVALDVFGLVLEANDLTLEKLQSYCKKITNKFLEVNPALKNREYRTIKPNEGWIHCGFTVPIPIDRESAMFEGFSINWKISQDQIFLEEITLNSLLSMAEESRRGNIF